MHVLDELVVCCGPLFGGRIVKYNEYKRDGHRRIETLLKTACRVAIVEGITKYILEAHEHGNTSLSVESASGLGFP